MNTTKRAAVAAIFVFVFGCMLPSAVLAVGKKKPQPDPSCGTTGMSTPLPVRKVVLRSVGTLPFQLPNGANVSIAADLQTLLNTAVTSTSTFSPTDPLGPGQDDLCDIHLEIRAAVSTLELNAFEFGVSFGYSPSGATSTVTNLTGKTTVRVGTIAMDFSVWECVNGRCSAVAATSASHLTAGVELNFDIDFAAVQTGSSLVYNTPLGSILRKIMNDGMGQLGKSPRLNELSWKAFVREYLPDAGILIFDAGAQSRLAPNQTFVVYAVTPSTGICRAYRPVAYVHTTHVDTISSVALIDQVLDSRGVKDGDLVMIRSAGVR